MKCLEQCVVEMTQFETFVTKVGPLPEIMSRKELCEQNDFQRNISNL